MILNTREDSLTSISLFFSFGVLSRIARRKRNVEIKLFGKQAMTYDAILKQAWGNYLIIAFINNQFLTSICLSTSFITSMLGRGFLREDAVKTEYDYRGGS